MYVRRLLGVLRYLRDLKAEGTTPSMGNIKLLEKLRVEIFFRPSNWSLLCQEDKSTGLF